MKINLFGVTIVGLIIATSACSQSGVEVSKHKYGEKWPFIVEKGYVDCVAPFAAIFRVDGKTYQLNGAATNKGYAAIDPIWRDNPNISGVKVNIGPMIDLALKQCK